MIFFSTLSGDAGNGNLSDVLKEGAFLLDVRTTMEFNDGSVDGAVNIPLDSLYSRLNELPKDQKIVVFCQSGGRSAEAKRIMEDSGFENVINGGGWMQVSYALSEAIQNK